MPTIRCGGWVGGPHEGKPKYMGIAWWRPFFWIRFTDGACVACTSAVRKRLRNRERS